MVKRRTDGRTSIIQHNRLLQQHYGVGEDRYNMISNADYTERGTLTRVETLSESSG